MGGDCNYPGKRAPKQCKNKLQCCDIHSRQSHITFHHITTTTQGLFGKNLAVSHLFLTRFWPVSELFLTTLCEQHVWAVYVWALHVWALYVWPLDVSTLCMSSMCEHSMCEHSMCDHSTCDHSMWAACCEHYMCEHFMCEHDVWAGYVWALYVWALYVWPLYVSTMCEHSMREHPVYEHHVWALYCVNTLCVSTLCVSTLCGHAMCDHSMWALYVWAPCVSTLYVSTMRGHSMCEHSKKYENYQGKIDISSWAGCCRTPKSTRITTNNEHQFLGRIYCRTPKRTKITTKNRHQFLGRMLQNTKKHENYHEQWTSVLGPDKKAKKVRALLWKPRSRASPEHRKVRELPRKMNSIEEVEEPKKYENYHAKPVSDSFKTIADDQKVREYMRIVTKNEHRRSWRAGNYENSQTKPVDAGRGQAETTKIHRQTEHASTKPGK